jgi:8-oxo-dGTP pyrophosphatase MutT (NUDIX family)
MPAAERPDVPVRPAATVILLRDRPTGMEVWLLTRVGGMAFASGMTVFPGGRADPADVELPWCGPPAREFADLFDCDESTARMLVGAAIRETFEETGLLLSRPPVDLAPDLLAELQLAVEDGSLPFATVLADHGLAVDAAAVRPWGRWVTPAGERRRYDTHFFVAQAPALGEATALTTEAASASWVRVSDAVAGSDRGERLLLPPTRAMLTSLEPFDTVAEVFAAAVDRPLAAVQPLRFADERGVRIELPEGTVIGWFPRGAAR